jgi:membrane associated rhomboid family serine protease
MPRSSKAIADDEASEASDHLFARAWEVPGHAHLVPVALVIVLGSIWHFADARALRWVVSWAEIERANPVPILLHMFVHESLVHLSLNAAALLLLSAPLIAQLGRPPASWLRYLYLFVGSGVCGAAAFLALNMDHQVSMLGSSGAIFGLLGAIARIHPLTGMAVSVKSRRTWLVTKFFIQNHFVLFAVAAVIAVTSGQTTLLAWEAHLGGLLFGFLAAPAFLARP